MSEMIAFNHRVTDEPIALVRLASDEGAVLHLVRLQHEPAAPDDSPCVPRLSGPMKRFLTAQSNRPPSAGRTSRSQRRSTPTQFPSRFRRLR